MFEYTLGGQARAMGGAEYNIHVLMRNS